MRSTSTWSEFFDVIEIREEEINAEVIINQRQGKFPENKPLLPNNSVQDKKRLPNVLRISALEVSDDDGRPRIVLNCGTREITALLDTGANVSVL